MTRVFQTHLAPLLEPNTDGMTKGSLAVVGWSRDGQILYAGGRSSDVGSQLLVAWAKSGRGTRRELPGDSDKIMSLSPLPNGGLLVATQDPIFKMLNSDDRVAWTNQYRTADFRDQFSTVAVSAAGSIVDFGFEQRGKAPVRFELRSPKLSTKPPVDHVTLPPKQIGPATEGFINSEHPTLNGKSIELYPYEISRSFAIHPDADRFVVGELVHSSP